MICYLPVFHFFNHSFVLDDIVLLYFEIKLFQNGNFFSLPNG
ncbi:flagellin [Brevibacillus laterosporus]|nr:flagellin [Brevibacillus laterosporus]